VQKLMLIPLIWIGIAFAITAQEPSRISDGEFKGFLPFAGNMSIRYGKPFKVREVCGLILFADDPNIPAVGLEFKIRGPGPEMTIRSSVTDQNGHFCIAGVPEGTYLFKTRLKDCKDNIGTIIKSHKAPHKNIVKLNQQNSD
jgi:hypothetical protein